MWNKIIIGIFVMLFPSIATSASCLPEEVARNSAKNLYQESPIFQGILEIPLVSPALNLKMGSDNGVLTLRFNKKTGTFTVFITVIGPDNKTYSCVIASGGEAEMLPYHQIEKNFPEKKG